MQITEINKDTFWALIGQAQAQWGHEPSDPNEWLMDRLVSMGPEQAKRFDTIARVYMDLAYQYGLWTAASVMERDGCSDDGFIDFRAWLVGQGKDVYMAALKDPDSLADAPPYHDCQLDSLPLMGDYAYEMLTSRNAFEDFDPEQYRALKTELEKDIVYGDGIGYPHLYGKKPVTVRDAQGQEFTVMAYVMTERYRTPAIPPVSYYHGIEEGYRQNGLPVGELKKAWENAVREVHAETFRTNAMAANISKRRNRHER